jgi:hypothetical protein
MNARPAGSVSATVAAVAGLGPLLATWRVKVTPPPGRTDPGGAVFFSCRSADGIGVVSALATLFVRSSSASWRRMVATFVTIVPAVEAASVPTIVIVSVPSATVSVGRLQLSMPPAPGRLQVKLGAVTALGVNPAGRGSRTPTFVPVSGPALRTEIV